MTIMLSPVAFRTFIVSSGQSYVADQYGVIANVTAGQDVTDLQSSGCVVLSPAPNNLLGKLLAANFNSTGDQQIPCLSNYKARVTKISIVNASLSLTTAAGGFYTAAAKGGTALVAAGQVYSSLTAANKALDATLAAGTLILPVGFSPLFFSLTTPQGATATADIYVYGDQYAQ